MKNPIKVQQGVDYRLYLVNMLEFDQVNSFHLHGNMFKYFPSGTSTQPSFTTDILTLGQGDRGIIEFNYPYPGKYMFHSHIAEFADLGWMTGSYRSLRSLCWLLLKFTCSKTK
jgi:FtsP/CotA-like multicopper oxidase with cupredoxin domain